MKVNKNYPWIVVGLLWVVALLNYMDRQMLSTMQGAIKADIVELNKAEVFGALMAVFMWVYGCFSPFAGVIADKLSRKWLVVGSLFVWSAVTLSMGFATNFETLYVLRALMGVSEALYIPSALALITDWHSGKSRSLAIGVHMTGLYVGQGLGGFGANLAHHFSWHYTFFALGLIGVLYSFVLMFLLYENPECSVKSRNTVAPGQKSESIWRGLGMVLGNWAFWIILFYFAVPSLPGWATKNWLPTLFSENLSLDMTAAGPMSTITISVSSFIGVICGGILSDRWAQRNVRGRIYTSAIGLSLTIPALLLLGFGHSVVGVEGIGYAGNQINSSPL